MPICNNASVLTYTDCYDFYNYKQKIEQETIFEYEDIKDKYDDIKEKNECETKTTINLQFKLGDKTVTRCYCRKNIEWFSEKVKGNETKSDELSHDPSDCNLTHYNPKYFNNQKLCGYSLARIPCPYGTKCNMLHSLNYPPILKSSYTDTVEKTIYEDGKIYNSAGVLFMTKDDDGEIYVNLFKSSNKVTRGKNIGSYYCGIAGGGINEDDESIAAAACRELYEESRKTLMISSSILRSNKKLGSFVEVPGKTLSGKRKAGLFACYICNLPNLTNILNLYYNDNKEIINKGNYNYCFNETSDLVKISIKDIKLKISKLSFSELKPMPFIVNGVNEYIDERTLKCLWTIIDKNNNSFDDFFDNFESLTDFEYYSDEDGINTFHF